MPSKRLILRHAVVSLSFVILYLLLNRPEVIFIARIGFVAGILPSVWYWHSCWAPARGMCCSSVLPMLSPEN